MLEYDVVRAQIGSHIYFIRSTSCDRTHFILKKEARIQSKIVPTTLSFEKDRVIKIWYVEDLIQSLLVESNTTYLQLFNEEIIDNKEKTGTAEIERKFLIRRLPEGMENYPGILMTYGYLMAESYREMRIVGLISASGEAILHFMTIKGSGTLNRKETEVMLNEEQFETLWPLTENTRLLKRRYFIPCDKHTAELDIYRDHLTGLCIVEVEFDSVIESLFLQNGLEKI